MALPKHMEESTLGKKSKKAQSVKSERALAKRIGGKTYIASGATFGQNDVTNDNYDFEHKMTGAKSYQFKLSEWDKLVRRTPTHKVPVFMLEFESGEKLVVLKFDDFEELHQ